MIRTTINLIIVAAVLTLGYWTWSLYTGRTWNLPETMQPASGTAVGNFGRALCRGWGGC